MSTCMHKLLLDYFLIFHNNYHNMNSLITTVLVKNTWLNIKRYKKSK